MKLVLYSGGDQSENLNLNKNLLELVSKDKVRMTFIPACSYHGQEDFQDIIDQFRPLGVKKFLRWDIDRPYSNLVRRTAFDSDIIYLGGGNTYYFLKFLKKEGLVTEFRKWVRDGGILCGMSAGAILLTKNIETAGFPDFDKDDNDEGIKNFNSLDLVEFSFFPHYKNSKRYDSELNKYSKSNEVPVYACPDGSGIVITGNEIKFVGKSACFVQGKKFFLNK